MQTDPSAAANDWADYSSTITVRPHEYFDLMGTFRVTLMLPNPERKLTSGLRCEVSFLDKPAPQAETADKGRVKRVGKLTPSYARNGES